MNQPYYTIHIATSSPLSSSFFFFLCCVVDDVVEDDDNNNDGYRIGVPDCCGVGTTSHGGLLGMVAGSGHVPFAFLVCVPRILPSVVRGGVELLVHTWELYPYGGLPA